MTSDSKINPQFFQLVMSLQIAAMQYLGKIVSPITGKVERNLEQAKASIELLSMLADKTRNNLSPDEEKFLSNMLFELRLNYLDELKKPPEPAASAADSEQKPGAEKG
ncbi:MAG: DUF1844 domain-containing protein [Candidatus Zixiibacteriota bacterium]